jgi:hypothetical protein
VSKGAGVNLQSASECIQRRSAPRFRAMRSSHDLAKVAELADAPDLGSDFGLSAVFRNPRAILRKATDSKLVTCCNDSAMMRSRPHKTR